MNKKETLIKAKELISDPSKWIKKVSALDNKGRGINPTDDNACKFCMLGAITKFDGTAFYNPWAHELNA